jgi:HTH-type transcriptional regulator/antitoxin HigA
LMDALAQLETLLIAPEETRHVPGILASCGVRFLVVERLPQAKIDGACCWLDKRSPVIGMSVRRDTIDNFWFVLRHEIEHVLREDGQDEGIIDDLEGKRSGTSTDLPEQERIANAAASNFCAPTAKLEMFMARKHPFYYERDVLAFAQTIHRHPGIVIGQMQFRLDNYAYLTRHLAKIRSLVLPSSIFDGWGQVPSL